MAGTTVDLSKFDKAFKEYMKFSQKSFADIVNTKAMFIARNATKTTDVASADQIRESLNRLADKGGPIAGILVNKKLGMTSQRGLQGSQMRAAINKLIALRIKTRAFLRSGWLPAIKKLLPFSDSKSNIKTSHKGADKGGAKVAKSGWKVEAEIWNSVEGGKKASNKVTKKLSEGLQRAIDKEVASMETYIRKKLDKGIERFNKG